MNDTIKKFIAILLIAVLMLSSIPVVSAAGTEFELPSSSKVFKLTGKSTNKKTEAEYLAIDGSTIYVLFMRRSDKPLVEGSIKIPGVNEAVSLSFPEEHYTYETAKVEGNVLLPKTASDGKYVWQVATGSVQQLESGDVNISAIATAGGFSLKNVTYSMKVSYGLLATKDVVAVNDVPVDGVPTVEIGDTILWHITIKNVGDFPVNGITVEDKLEGAWLSSYDPFDLVPGEERVIEARYVVQPKDAGTTVINVIAAQSSGGMVEAGTSGESIISYTVTYDANGGTEAPDLQNKDHDESVSLHETVPKREGYRFDGWNTEPDGSGMVYIPGQTYTNNANLQLYAQWTSLRYMVIFHANNADADCLDPETGNDVFRTYDPAGWNSQYTLNEDGTITTFYDIPTFDYETHNKYVFAGWYTAPDETGTAMDWQQVYDLSPGDEVHLYAHWLETGTVAQEDDGKAQVGTYNGFDLVGTQVRTKVKDDKEHYGDMDSGLRFITVLSEELWRGIAGINDQNSASAQYGFLLCKKTTADQYDADQLQYKAANSNGQDTTKTHAFLNNVRCDGVTDHFNGIGYRLYTMVVTYKNMEGAALDAAMAQQLVARSYMGYYDANGLYRYHYNNYTGDAVYHGCSSSYADALELG